VRPGEDASTAYNRMKTKIPAGKNLEETYILLPEAVPAAGGVNPNVPAPNAPLQPSGTLFPIEQPASGEGSPTATGSLFDGTPVAAPVKCHAAATSALNLLGKTEGWGIGPATTVHNVNLKLDQLTGAQLQKLLKGLPDGFSYELDLDKEQS